MTKILVSSDMKEIEIEGEAVYRYGQQEPPMTVLSANLPLD